MVTRIRIIIILMLLCGCSGHTPDERLARIAGIVSDSPGEALAALDSIDPGSLPEADRHYHDFHTVKANDKAYNRHTSDSLILDVIDYYESHQSTGLYPEALYYGGRVYSDLGDYPTAIFYYQKSLGNINDDDMSSLHLKGNVTSQLGRQFNYTLRPFRSWKQRYVSTPFCVIPSA